VNTRATIAPLLSINLLSRNLRWKILETSESGTVEVEASPPHAKALSANNAFAERRIPKNPITSVPS
jgi:hypothetical protein